MYIDILNIVEGKEYTIEKTKKGDDKLFVNRSIRFNDDITIIGNYVYYGDTLTVNAEVIISLSADCDRCLKETKRIITIPFNEVFTKDNEDVSYSIDNNKVKLDDAIAENILLSIPDRILCKEDCRGICAVCGSDLNTTGCQCDRETEDKNPFAILKTIVGGAKNGSTKK